jgi:poly(beta-D-mannuronate) lyase
MILLFKKISDMKFYYKILFLLCVISTPVICSTIEVTSAAEIREVCKKASPGDIILMKDGKWLDQQILFSGSGTFEKPIILKAETPGKVILTGTSRLNIAGVYLIVDGLCFYGGNIDGGAVVEFRDGEKGSDYCRLTNCSIENYNPTDVETDTKWISLYGTHNRVDHCFTKNKKNSGCLLVVWVSDKPNYHIIDSNYFAFRPKLGFNGAEIIRVGTSEVEMNPSYTTVEYNYFEDCNGETEVISNKSCYNTYRYNTFVRCQGTLTLRHGKNCLVEGNFFFGQHVKKTGGIRVIGENHTVINNYLEGLEGQDAFSALAFMNGVKNSPANRYFQVKNALIAFNTFVNNKHNITIGVGANAELSLPPVDCIIANNIVLGTEENLINEISKPENFKWEGNILYGTSSGIDFNDGIYFVNPELQKAPDGLWRITKHSPAVGNAKGDYPLIKLDIDGQERKGTKDIGCDQLSDEPVKNKPLNNTNTGPYWMHN